MNQELELINNFEHLTKEIFAFLSSDYGFVCRQEERMGTRFSSIIYENEKEKIKINFDTYSFEIGFYLSENIVDATEVSIGDLVKFYAVEKETGLLEPQASTVERLETTLHNIAEFLKKYAASFLQDERDEFQKIIVFMRANGINNVNKLKLDLVRNKIEMAWKNKSYSEVISLYEPLENILDKTELARLQYARKHSK